ncbi:hypothetical protein ABE425_14715 [Chryseobacterium cucumeris]|uniref:hypothetical protein n=1 Tax=Chryseobacterium cucumeris TaxID=1813611 RepID=UPI00320BAE7B
MTTLELILSLTTILFFGLFVVSLYEMKQIKGIIDKYKSTTDNQQLFIDRLSRDCRALSFSTVIAKSKQVKMKRAIEDFLQNCNEEIEIENFKEKLRAAIK